VSLTFQCELLVNCAKLSNPQWLRKGLINCFAIVQEYDLIDKMIRTIYFNIARRFAHFIIKISKIGNY
jgi:hypothetical protein